MDAIFTILILSGAIGFWCGGVWVVRWLDQRFSH